MDSHGAGRQSRGTGADKGGRGQGKEGGKKRMKPSQRRRGCNRSKLAPSHRHFLCRISVPAPSCRLHPAGAGHDTLTRKSRKAAGHAGKRLGQSVPRSWLACPARIRGLSLPGQMSHRQNSKWRIEEGAWTSRHITHPPQQVRTDTNLNPPAHRCRGALGGGPEPGPCPRWTIDAGSGTLWWHCGHGAHPPP